ncbi:hypothetical protein C8R45DRAFT_847617 [Mycena sanguinolenta]|nr:hypothetical protein C8R45DRAFT_847617 [Mycena sanguinolenta]
MKFAAAFLAAVVLCEGALAQLTPTQVVAAINLVTQISANTNLAIIMLTTSTPGDQVQTGSMTLVNNLNTIINDISADTSAIEATPPFTDNLADPVVAALDNVIPASSTTAVDVNQKHPIFAQFTVTAPIAAVLPRLEATIDAFASAMIDLIPTRESDVTSDKSSLDASVENTITVYAQVCIPSPFYPTVLPFCSDSVAMPLQVPLHQLNLPQ